MYELKCIVGMGLKKKKSNKSQEVELKMTFFFEK